MILQTINLKKEYNKKIVLENINMNIKQGEIYGLIGENGAGKTTLFRVLTGLSYKSSGQFILFGDHDSKLKNNRSSIGCVIEAPMLYPYLTAYQNLKIEALERGIFDEVIIKNILNLVNLSSTKNKKVGNFSLGMKQRLAKYH